MPARCCSSIRVTALGGIPVEVDGWGIDAVYTGTQKCLSCPPGLAPVTFSPRAVEKVRSAQDEGAKLVSRSDDARQLLGPGPRLSPHGADQHDLRRCTKRCGWCSKKDWKTASRGIAQTIARCKAGLAAIGIEYAAQDGHQLPMLNAVKIPDGVDDAAVRGGLLNRFGIEIGGGLGAFKGKVWRIGLMGYGSRPANVLLFLAALEQLLAEQGLKFDHGASIAAANAAYLGA